MSAAEPPREFIDSNVLVYGHSASSGQKWERASTLLARLWESETGCLSIQVLQESFVTLTRKVSQPLPSVQAGRVIEEYGRWTIHSPRAADVVAAIDLSTKLRVSFWDAMIIRSAHALGCQVLWSEDLNDGQSYAGVTARNPFAA